MPACASDADWPDVSDQTVLLADEIASLRAVLEADIPEADVVAALTRCGGNPERAINALLDDAAEVGASTPPVRVKAELPEVKPDASVAPMPRIKLKSEVPKVNHEAFKKEPSDDSSQDDPSCSQDRIKKESSDGLSLQGKIKKGQSDNLCIKEPFCMAHRVKKEQFDDDFSKKDAVLISGRDINLVPRTKKRTREDEETIDLTTTHPVPYLNARPIRALPPPDTVNQYVPGPVRAIAPVNTDWRLVVAPPEVELGEFPEESDWFLVGKSYVTGLSTCRGRRMIDAGEIVHFTFPSQEIRFGGINVSNKTAAALAAIVRFSTKRSGEIGRLSPEWTRCLVPLVSSSKVKIQGRCVFPTMELRLMQEIVLYVSFYIHSSVFTGGDKSSWKLTAPANIDYSANPLLTLFKLLKMKPFKMADFNPEELNTRKRSLNLRDDDDEAATEVVGLEKRRRGGPTYPEQSNDEQAISEASLNKIVGTAETYDLEEAEPPSTLVSVLRPYQKQALFWMSELEKGIDVDCAAKTLHPCWNAYNLVDKRASAVYVNIFSGEATPQFPSATHMARGGILADAMGLGKTVMTIALILSNPRGEQPNHLERDSIHMRDCETRAITSRSSVKGGTLIVCPMALLGQWKDELEAHSTPGALYVFVYYGGDKTDNLRLMAAHSVVLTTYGVLSSVHKSDSSSVFHKIDWYRVVLDEAHTIKSAKTKVAQAAFGLSSHCRWCLTGTPLQNNLEDLYSLLCFLHVEPWCNATWWQKLIQKPYENGDERGLSLVKAILRPLMLRRTKETKDKLGNSILVLPPVNIDIVECEQSEAERDFYEALFRRSKVRFDQFVAQGKVLHNYASILELLLRLRQCCNHPFLVMSRGDTQQQHTDLDRLARRFLEGAQGDSGRSNAMPSRAYVEEVVEDLRQGVVTECPICLESASDDPVLTPCAHRMCRECLLTSWRTPSGGPCPLCRSPISKADLITLPTESRFQVDNENNWKESCKVSKLIMILENILRKKEKSIVFSQWTVFFDLLEIPFNQKGIQFLRFDGKLSQKHRERVLKEFSESNDKLVLLMSLKAGGVGLNLTAASNVFLMDPWWNPAVEEQAIMRIHRIGQKRVVQVRRFIVKDTVEERMQQVQARKQRMISGALTDEEVRSARIKELKMLFT